jgi:hypothetical protein
MRFHLACLALVAALAVAGCGSDDSADTSTATVTEATTTDTTEAKPVKVTDADLKFMADTIVSDFREGADLAGDYRSDYSAKCEQTGVGTMKCEIQPYDKGDPLLPYTKQGRFDPADPSRFTIAGVDSPKGTP